MTRRNIDCFFLWLSIAPVGLFCWVAIGAMLTWDAATGWVRR
jgi:hypothetical protein